MFDLRDFKSAWISKHEILNRLPSWAMQAKDHDEFFDTVQEALSKSHCRRFLPKDVWRAMEQAWKERESLLG